MHLRNSKKSLMLSLLYFTITLCESQLVAQECGDIDPRGYSISVKRLEGSGVGYSQGYSSIEAFISPNRCLAHSWIPYLDLRGHLTDDGRPALNTGIGIRQFNTVSWGINTYYDYRKTKHFHYNQVGLGLEAFGSFWSVSLNGYLPVGGKCSSFYDTQFVNGVSSGNILSNQLLPGYFLGHHLIISSESDASFFFLSKQEFAMRGIDANASFRLFNRGQYAIDLSGGPYYYDGYLKKYACGGKGNLSVRLTEFVSLSGTMSYDNLFHLRGSGELSIHIPFGKRFSQKKQCKTHLCEASSFVRDQISRGAQRAEMIVVDHGNKSWQAAGTLASTSVAINPLTNLPYFFWFVDNRSSSNGTFESPFSDLASAESASLTHDIIFVFAGDSSSVGMDNGIILKDHQQLIGSGIAHDFLTTLGIAHVPIQQPGLPVITNLNSNHAITCANDNIIAGVHVVAPETSSSSAIYAYTSMNLRVRDNKLEYSGGYFYPNPSLVVIEQCNGLLSINNNDFDLLSGNYEKGVQIISPNPTLANYQIFNNTFNSGSGFVSGLEFGDGPNSMPINDFQTLLIVNNQFNGLTQKTGGGYGFNGSGKIIFDSNTITNYNSYTNLPGNLYIRIRRRGKIDLEITNNTWLDSLNLAKPSVYIQPIASAPPPYTPPQVCVTLDGNITDAMPNGYILNNADDGVFRADLGTNTGSVSEIGTIIPGTCP